jgi:imidazolonepropionase-like amidohydrolase
VIPDDEPVPPTHNPPKSSKQEAIHMTGRIFVVLAVVLCSRAIFGQQLLIENVTIVSPDRAAQLPNAAVLIEDGRIARIEANPHRLTAENVIDGGGRFLAPGLIDSHVHLGGNAGFRGDQARKHADLLAGFQAREPLNYLAFGFTTLVDVSASQAFADRWNALPVRPDLHFCIATPFANGYGMAFEPESVRFDTPYFLYDPRQADAIPPQYDPGDHSPAAVVAKVRQTDAACIKAYYEEGFGGLFDFPVPPVALIRELADEARAAGLIVALHANSLAAWRFAYDAEVDMIAHGPWHWGDWNHARSVEPAVSEILDGVIDKGIAVQMTARVIHAEKELIAGGFLDDPRLEYVYGSPLLQWYGSDDGAWFRYQLLDNYTANPGLIERFIGQASDGDTLAPSRAAIDRLDAAGRYLADNGAQFLFGSDTPSSPAYTTPPGYNGLLEIRQLHAMGLGARKIFAALTIDNARAFGLDREIGTVSVGKKANLLLLEHNPLEDIRAYDSIRTVIVGGEPYSPAELLE